MQHRSDDAARTGFVGGGFDFGISVKFDLAVVEVVDELAEDL